MLLFAWFLVISAFGQTDKITTFKISSTIESFELNEQRVEDLKTLALVWGFLKYYHLEISSGQYDWDSELFRILPPIIQSKTTDERDEFLSQWIKSFGEFTIAENEKEEKADVKTKPDLDWICNSGFSEQLSAELLNVKNAKRRKRNYYLDLNTGPGNPNFKNEAAYAKMEYPDPGFRLLSLYRYWNIIQYYFPYKNLIEEDWKSVLHEFIPKFIDAKNQIEYKLLVLELIARINDTHANIWQSDAALEKFWGINFVPYEVHFVENQAVVTDCYDGKPGQEKSLEVGDIITKINNEAVADIVKARLKYTPASNYPTQLRDIAKKLLRSNDTILWIEFLRNGKAQTAHIKTFPAAEINLYKKHQSVDTCFRFINDDIAYLYLGSIKKKYIKRIFKEIKDTKGLIIDLRCYPSEFVVYKLGKYLMSAKTEFVKFTKGSIETPGLFTFDQSIAVGQKNKDYYKGKVVILVNEATQSQAEYTAMAFRVASRARVVGSTTAGADGNVSFFYLPGGIRTAISGIGVYYPDKTETQGIGIVPDIEVHPTIEGIQSAQR